MDALNNTIQWIVTSPFICVGWILVGAIAGAFARRIMGAEVKPFIQDLILGIAGAAIGGIALRFVTINTPDGGVTLVIFNLILATITATILVAIGRAIRGSNKTESTNVERKIPRS